ncbi:MAG: TlpA disulfide reductase family protein [Actinobacteria bacterium]|nr:TlpA disulfide reductase family protein [Actinomycetota bacterium]
MSAVAMNRRTPAVLIALALCLPALVAGCGRDAPPSTLVGTTIFAPDEREALPPVSGPTTDGSTLAVSDLQGRVVVLNSWASWCAPCRDEVPVFVAIAEQADPAQVAVVGLDVNDDPAAAAAFEQDLGMTYPSIVDADGSILATIPGVPPTAIPSTVVIDRDGRIAARIIGEADQKELSSIIAAVAAEPTSGSG